MEAVTGTIFAIERCSFHDGPGIRTTIFLKGCPLQCLWCHNPESQSATPEVYFLHERCAACGACVRVCEHNGHQFIDNEHRIDRSDCVACRRCEAACVSGALELKGETMDVQTAMTPVLKDRDYYANSGGGMTLSGGEPLAQHTFTRALLQAARDEEIHTCLQTCGYAPGSKLMELTSLVDLFLFDWKESDPVKHREYTGVDSTRIRENLEALDRAGAAIRLRCPIVPTLNDRPDHFAAIAELANRLPHVEGIDVLPYHPMGSSKSRRLGKSYPLPDLPFAEKETAEQWRDVIRGQTDKPVN